MRAHRFPLNGACAAFLILSGLSPLLTAQQTRGGPVVAPMLEKVEVNLMTLDVSVTDAGGTPVTGIGPAEFRVEVDGNPLGVTYVDEVRRGSRPAVIPPEQLQKDPAAEPPASRTADAAIPRYLTIFVDSRNTTAGSRNRALHALRDLVLKMTGDDQVLLLNFTGDLQIVRPYTTSKEALLSGLSVIEKTDAGGFRRITRARSAMDQIGQARGRGAMSRRASIANSYSQEISIENRQLLSSLETSLRDLAGQPGRRALLYLSDGFETRPGEQISDLAVGRFGSRMDLHPISIDLQIGELFRKANGSAISLFSVDASGLDAPSGIDAEFSLPPDIWGNSGIASKANMTDGMRLLAEQTGGSALIDSNDLAGGLGRIYDELTNYYQLGLKLPEGEKIDKYRDVEVSVPGRKGIRIHARHGYAGQSAEKRIALQIEAALAAGRPMNDLPVHLDARVAKKGGFFSDYEVEVSITIAGSEVTWIPEGDKSSSRLEVYLEAIDDSGQRSELELRPWRPVAASAAETAKPLRFDARLKIRKGNQRILAAVRDSISEKVGAVEYPMRVE